MERKNKNKHGPGETSLIRSSAAKYLTFVAASGEGDVGAVYADENIGLIQKIMDKNN